MSPLSHHSSNPLEARTSDPTNQAYHRRYARARATQERERGRQQYQYEDRDHEMEMSSDELGRWDEGEAYRAHVQSVVGSGGKGVGGGSTGKNAAGKNTPKKLDETPKAGPSRLRSVTTASATTANTVTPKRQARPAWVDLDEDGDEDEDEDMESDDPLSLTATPKHQQQSHHQYRQQHHHQNERRANTNANTNTNGQGTLDPRKEFGGGDMHMVDDQEDHDDREQEDQEEEEEHEYVPMPEDVEEEDDELEVLPPFEDASNLKRVVVDSDDQEGVAEPMEVAYDNDDEDNAGEDREGEEGDEKPERTEFYNEIVAYMEVQDARMAEQEELDNVRNADEQEHEGADDDDERPARSRSRSSSAESALTPLTDSSHSRSRTPLSSPSSSRPSSPDEYHTLTKRPPEEQEEILSEISQLYKSVPDLIEQYEVVDRLGTGTFSSVYKAVDLNYDEWENRPWQGHHPGESTAYYQSAGGRYRGRGGRAEGWRRGSGSEGGKMRVDRDRDDGEEEDGRVYVAIKRIYTTSGPERIRNELSILEDARSCRHVSQIITAFRHEDQVVIVLPYQRNMDFREFYQDLHPEGIKCYFRCLLRALRDIHARGIIHRDVKPANFLYNPFTGIGTLCDFGLASRMDTPPAHATCLHTPFSPTDPHGKIISYTPADSKWMKQAQKDARAKSLMSAERVGWPEQDRRPVNKANRAGTRGFRAPEVLLKCTAQTGAIDVWAAGVILLFFLTGKFPIFQSNDDVEGLMEITAIIGKKNMEKVATLHARTLATNIPDMNHEGISWEEFVQRLNPDLMKPRKYDMRFYPHNSKHKDGRRSSANVSSHSNSQHRDTTSTSTTTSRHANPLPPERHQKEMKNALSFLAALLQVESVRRATPRKALGHKFLEEGDVHGGVHGGVDADDAYIPHRIGEGICARLHTVEHADPERPWGAGGGNSNTNSSTRTNTRHIVTLVRKCVCEKTRREVLSREVLRPIGKEGSDGYEDEDEVVVDLDEWDSGEEGEGSGGEAEAEAEGGGYGGAQGGGYGDGGNGAGYNGEGYNGEARRRTGRGRWCGEWVEDERECEAGEGVAIGNRPCEFHRHLSWDVDGWEGVKERKFI